MIKFPPFIIILVCDFNYAAKKVNKKYLFVYYSATTLIPDILEL